MLEFEIALQNIDNNHLGKIIACEILELYFNQEEVVMPEEEE